MLVTNAISNSHMVAIVGSNEASVEESCCHNVYAKPQLFISFLKKRKLRMKSCDQEKHCDSISFPPTGPRLTQTVQNILLGDLFKFYVISEGFKMSP